MTKGSWGYKHEARYVAVMMTTSAVLDLKEQAPSIFKGRYRFERDPLMRTRLYLQLDTDAVMMRMHYPELGKQLRENLLRW